MMEPVIRTDDFNLLTRDKFFIELRLIVKEKHQIELAIIYIDEKGISGRVKKDPEIIIQVNEILLLSKWAKIIHSIRKLEDDVATEVLKGIQENKYDISEIDNPNEYTMSESSWFKHSFIFLAPFHSYDGALLRLSYLIGELLCIEALSEKDILIDEELKDFTVDLKVT